MKRNNKNKGFTLLEILLVITLIGILIGILLVSVNPNRQLAQARNLSRKSHITDIHTALEANSIRNSGAILSTVTTTYQDICDTGTRTATDALPNTNYCNGKLDLRVLVPTYINSIPKDNQETVTGNTGYQVAKNNKNQISIIATRAELRESIAINPITVVTNGLVLNLDAGNKSSYPETGNTWFDLSGKNNHGTLFPFIGGPTYSNINGGDFAFNGVNNYVTINQTLSTPFTITSFIRYTDQSKTLNTLINTNPHTVLGISLNRLGGGQLYVYIGNGSSWLAGPSIISSSNMLVNTWYQVAFTSTGSGSTLYINGNNVGTSVHSPSGWGSTYYLGALNFGGEFLKGNISSTQIYNRALTAEEIQQNYLALLKVRYEKGGINNPFSSPTEARVLGYTSGYYYFQSGSMSSPQLLEFERDYYENKGWVCVFRSPYRSTATTNKIGLNIPMGGLLVQRDALDLRAAVYWSNPITYNSVGGTGNNTADSGYSPRRVILGHSGGHGIFSTNQQQCNWGIATGAIGAGWDGSTCGSFPNDLVWGTGRSDTATYENRSGVWSHWVTW